MSKEREALKEPRPGDVWTNGFDIWEVESFEDGQVHYSTRTHSTCSLADWEWRRKDAHLVRRGQERRGDA